MLLQTFQGLFIVQAKPRATLCFTIGLSDPPVRKGDRRSQRIAPTRPHSSGSTRVASRPWFAPFPRDSVDGGGAITSLAPAPVSAAQLLELWRRHWEIENRVHWVRDVTFGEDACRVHQEHGPEVWAALRNTALGILRAGGETNIARGLRHFANRPSRVLAALGLPPLDNE